MVGYMDGGVIIHDGVRDIDDEVFLTLWEKKRKKLEAV
jgi:hypothetical protein